MLCLSTSKRALGSGESKKSRGTSSRCSALPHFPLPEKNARTAASPYLRDRGGSCRKTYVNFVPCYLRNRMDNAFGEMNRRRMTLLSAGPARTAVSALCTFSRISQMDVYFCRCSLAARVLAGPPLARQIPTCFLNPPIAAQNVALSGYRHPSRSRLGENSTREADFAPFGARRGPSRISAD